MNRDEALAFLAGEGSDFETCQVELNGVPHTGFKHGPKTLRELFEDAARFGDKPFVVFEDERLTFAETYARAATLAYHLRSELGVAPGDHVAVAMRNYPEWIVAYIAISSIGAVVVALNAWWTGSELRYGLADSGSVVALLDGERFGHLQPHLDGLACRVAVTRMQAPPAGAYELEALMGGPIGAPLRDHVPMPAVEIDPHMDATILYTSGTTDAPKGAVSTHLAVTTAIRAFEVMAVVRALGIAGPEEQKRIYQFVTDPAVIAGRESIVAMFPAMSLLVNVPLFHVTGCNTMFLPSCRFGRKLVLMRRWDPDEAVRLIERERVTQVHGVPTMTWDLLSSPEFEKRDTSSLVLLGAGGAAQSPERLKQIRERAPRTETGLGYGMTETNALGSGISGEEYEARPASVGRPFAPIVTVKVVDMQGRELPVGSTGEICLKTASAIRGYWGRPQETAETLVDGWIQTGDLGHVDEQGFIFITDRAKEIVIRGGENISCREVESVLFEYEGVREAAVYGLPDQRLGERLVAAVRVAVPTPAHLSEEALKAHVRARLAAFKVPEEVALVEGPLPRVASGKLDRRALRTRARSAS